MICAQCGADLPEGALFCGECGSAVYATPTPAPRVSAPPSLPVPSMPSGGGSSTEPDVDSDGSAGGDGNSTRVVDLLEQADHWRPTPSDFLAPAPPASPAPDQARIESGSQPESDSAAQPDAGSSASSDAEVGADAETGLDEVTRMPDRGKPAAAQFTLHFSTGESVRVEGTGLIGRRPAAQPGEFFDWYVTVDDPGRSVSKTHLEFGQEGGVFWISDRFSANGTVVREPEKSPRLCPAGMRSRVARGSRIDIGEQFFVVT